MGTKNKMKRTPAKAGTKRISFLKLLLMDIKERNWLLALMCAVSAVVYPIGTLLVLESTREAERARAAASFLGMTGGYFFLFLPIAAFLAGISGFMYLERQDKADFFMSFAVRREKFFFVPYLSGWLISVVPYVFFMLLAVFPVCGFRGCLTSALVAASFRAMGFNILGFTAIYSVVVLSMVLSGRMLIGFLLSVFFLFYGSCASILMDLLRDTFFRTWYSYGGMIHFLPYSPVSAMAYFDTAPTKGVFLELLWLLPSLIAAVLIYVKRPAETAENAFTFSWMAPILKTVISIPVGISGGLLLFAVAIDPGRGGWFIFGSVVAAFIANGVIEFVIAPDLKNVARHWISGAVILAGALGISAVFAFDLTGYDRWYPDKNDVQAMAVSEDFVTAAFGEFSSVNSYYDDNYLTELTGEQSYLKRNLVENFDGIYELAGLGVEEAKKVSDEKYYRQTAVLYKMKSGRMVYRSYTIPIAKAGDAIRRMGSETEFRKLYYPYGQFDPGRFNALSAQSWSIPGIFYDRIDLTEEESREFFAALEKDSSKMNLADAFEAEPLLILYPSFEWVNYGEYEEKYTTFSLGDTVGCIYVYENYENTLAWIEQKSLTKNLRREDRITSATCYIYNNGEDQTPVLKRILEAAAGNYAYFTDEESIRTLLSSVKRLKQWQQMQLDGSETQVDLSFELESEYGEHYSDGWSAVVADEEALVGLFLNNS